MPKEKFVTLTTYEQFKTLYFALRGAHVFQGYGKLYRVDVDKIDEETLKKYNLLIAQLRLIEEAQLSVIKIEDLALRMLAHPDVSYISRKSIYAFLKEHPEFLEIDDEKATSLETLEDNKSFRKTILLRNDGACFSINKLKLYSF